MKTEAVPAGLGGSGNWSPASTNIVRSICNPINQDEDLFDTTFTIFANGVSWDSSHDAVALISEIQTSNVDNTHMIAATTMQVLAFFEDAPDLTASDQYATFLRKASQWGSHMLWDFTVTYMQSVASGLRAPNLQLPGFTAEPTLLAADGHTPLDASLSG